MVARDRPGANYQSLFLARLCLVAGRLRRRTEDILAASGAGKSQFYHYFSSKEELVVEVLRHQLDQILKEQSRFRPDTWEGISAWFEAMVDMQQNQRGYRGCPLGPITSELLDQGDLLRSRAADAFTRWETVLSDGLRAMQTTGCCARTPIPLPSQTRRSP